MFKITMLEFGSIAGRPRRRSTFEKAVEAVDRWAVELDDRTAPGSGRDRFVSQTTDRAWIIEPVEQRDRVVVDQQGRPGVVDGPRCTFCKVNGIARCRHVGM